jgi:hypothetical protein
MANTSISNLAAGAAVSATDIVPNVQTAGVGPVKTTAAQLKTYMSDSPTLVTPTLGVATATSINKIALTAPATAATLTIANNKTLTANNTLTFTGTDSSSVAFGTGGTVAYTGGTLDQFASTTSAQLAGVISDETGSGALVFGTTPTFTTSIIAPLAIGGTGTTSTLTLRSTSGVGTTGADIVLQAGNNGATELARFANSGNVAVGTSTTTGGRFVVQAAAASAQWAIRAHSAGVSNESGLYVDVSNNMELAVRNGSGTLTGAIRSAGDSYVNSATGNFGVGTNAPATTLHSNGTIRYTNRPAAGTITAIGFDTNGDLKASSSSLRYKYDIADYNKGLDVVNQLRPVLFKFNGETRENIGFVAEEIDTLGLTEIMLYDEQDRPEGVLYSNMVSLLTKAIQELSAALDAAESRIADLEAR